MLIRFSWLKPIRSISELFFSLRNLSDIGVSAYQIESLNARNTSIAEVAQALKVNDRLNR